MHLKYHILTLGCQKNEYDSQVIAGLIASAGYTEPAEIENADLIVLNTCCIRNKADVKVYGRLGQYADLKLQNPNLIIVVAGCLAQKDGKRLLSRFRHVNLVIGTRNLELLPHYLEETARTGKRRFLCDMKDMNFEHLPVLRDSSCCAWIPISEGCDCHCTYCIVPFVRGTMVSRTPENILDDVREFVSSGGLEITLLGQNVNAYGKDNPAFGNFASLLTAINGIEGLKRIRFTSPHPANFGEDFIRTMASLDKVCEHVHLPLQSGDDLVLRRMGRNYTTQDFKSIVEMLRKYIPGIAITTDIIVGFPGETAAQFENTLSFIKEIRLDGAFMFAYSEREGTAAVKMKDSVPHNDRMERLNLLIKVQNEITMSKHVSAEGSVVEVLPETVSRKNSDFLTGKTRTRAVVNFAGLPEMVGKMTNVKLLKGYTWGFMGEGVK